MGRLFIGRALLCLSLGFCIVFAEGCSNGPAAGATPPPPPPTPQGLTATAGNDQIELEWGASTGATSYNVGRSTTSGGPYSKIATSANTAYTDTTASNGTKYYYVVAAVNSDGSSGDSAQVSAIPGAASIQHIVVIFQENRTPDNLFHGLPNADIANAGVNSLGQTITLSPTDLATDYDLSHTHFAFKKMYDDGKMDGADLIPVICQTTTTNCAPANAQFQYVNPSEVQPYFQLAQKYTFGDRMFQTNQGPSFPAHQIIISGTSAPTATSDLFASENPEGVMDAKDNTGCTAPPAEFVLLINPSGTETQEQFPCFEHPTLTDLLDAQAISWRYYAPSPGSIWTGPNAIEHMCQPQTQNGAPVCTGPDWTGNVIIPQTQVLTDVANGKLAQVTWVVPDGKSSDHAEANDGSGPSWVASVVNAIGNSPYWATTAIFITWDDWGGWYDHVPPTVINAYEYGFRVPLIVVSPYAKAGYVSHVVHDFGSILKFIEKTFTLPSLGYADAAADDFSDCFDLQQTPIKFQTVASPLHADFFLNDQRPPTDPDDD